MSSTWEQKRHSDNLKVPQTHKAISIFGKFERQQHLAGLLVGFTRIASTALTCSIKLHVDFEQLSVVAETYM